VVLRNLRSARLDAATCETSLTTLISLIDKLDNRKP
jgi:hypothetical protein